MAALSAQWAGAARSSRTRSLSASSVSFARNRLFSETPPHAVAARVAVAGALVHDGAAGDDERDAGQCLLGTRVAAHQPGC